MDFHSHILPGIDDGSQSLEETVELLRLEARQGIDAVIATPHFYPDRDKPEAFLKNRARAVTAMGSVRVSKGIQLKPLTSQDLE